MLVFVLLLLPRRVWFCRFGTINFFSLTGRKRLRMMVVMISDYDRFTGTCSKCN